MTATRLATLRAVLRLVMAVFFLGGFVLHMTAVDALVAITPDWVPFPRAVALITGWLELAGGLGLLLPRTRFALAARTMVSVATRAARCGVGV
jgi:uncharacterized membrane protein